MYIKLSTSTCTLLHGHAWPIRSGLGSWLWSHLFFCNWFLEFWVEEEPQIFSKPEEDCCSRGLWTWFLFMDELVVCFLIQLVILSVRSTISSALGKEVPYLDVPVDRCSGQELEKEPEFLDNGDSDFVKMILIKPTAVKTFSKYPPFGCFAVPNMR